MLFSPAKASANRLKKVLVNDKDNITSTVTNIIKSDIITLLEGYMYVDSDSVFVNFNLNSDGSYNFSITGKATHTKKVGFYNKTQY